MISVVRCQFGGISNCRLSICSKATAPLCRLTWAGRGAGQRGCSTASWCARRAAGGGPTAATRPRTTSPCQAGHLSPDLWPSLTSQLPRTGRTAACRPRSWTSWSWGRATTCWRGPGWGWGTARRSVEDPGDHTKAVLVLTACWCSGAGAVPAAEQLHGAPWGPHAELQGRRLVPALAPVQAHLPTLQRWDIAPLSSIPRYYPLQSWRRPGWSTACWAAPGWWAGWASSWSPRAQ